MRRKPKSVKDLKDHGSESEELLNFLKKHWDGLDKVKPKGYDKFLKKYCDFDGMEEWEDNEKGHQEDEFKGFDDGDDGFNFVRMVSLPQVAYDDTCQGRSPIQMLISSCISYGFARGFLYGKERGIKDFKMDLASKLLKE